MYVYVVLKLMRRSVCVCACVCVCVCVLIVVSMVMRWDTTSRRRGGSLLLNSINLVGDINTRALLPPEQMLDYH